jgi:nitroreductase
LEAFYRRIEIPMSTKANTFDQIVEERRSIRKFDIKAAFDHDAVKRSIDRAILSANSSNMQLWEFYRVKSEKARADISTICLGQNAAKTANEMVVFVARPDLWKDRQEKLVNYFLTVMPDKTARKAKMTYSYYEQFIPQLYNVSIPWFHDMEMKALILKNKSKPFMRDIMTRDVPIITHKSVALAAQTFMLSIKAEGYDSCPMEGHDSVRLKKYLNLPDAAEISMVIGVGKGLPEGIYGDRFRIPNEDVIFEL